MSPEELAPEKLEEVMRNFGAILLTKRTGTAVDPELGFRLTYEVTREEFQAAEVAEFARLAERFADLNDDRASSWPPGFSPFSASIFARTMPDVAKPVFRDEQTLETFARAAIHDEAWVDRLREEQ